MALAVEKMCLDCELPAKVKGRCRAHYVRENTRLRTALRAASGDFCGIPGCRRVAYAKKTGLCNTHKIRLERHGTSEPSGTPPKSIVPWLLEHASYNQDECLIWPFALGPQGRGSVRMDGVAMPAARAMCIIAHGPPPFPKAEAAHRCGKGDKGCVSPQCVYWATKKQNVADAMAHGTFPVGEASTSAKLTEEQVIAIRATDEHPSILSKRLGVSRGAVWHVRNGTTWKHLIGASSCR